MALLLPPSAATQIVLLKGIAMAQPTAKTIVFSQWAGVLHITAVGLSANGIVHADAFSKGGRAQDKVLLCHPSHTLSSSQYALRVRLKYFTVNVQSHTCVFHFGRA